MTSLIPRDEECPFSALLIYRRFGFYQLINCVTERHYWAVCDAFQCGTELDKQHGLARRLPPAPIPFMRRWGSLVLAIAFVALMLFAALSDDL